MLDSTQERPEVIYANLVKHSQRERPCIWCGKPIPAGFAYQRIIQKDSGFRCDAVCLDCWTASP
jgi:hypothetical protein